MRCYMSNQVFDISVFPILKTERLLLRRPETADAADVLAFRGDVYVQRFNSKPITSVGEAEQQILEAQA